MMPLLLALALVGADSTATVRGIVVQADGKPVGYANVIVVGTRRGVQCGDDGRFEIRSVPLGPQTLRVLPTGFMALSRAIVVKTSMNDSLRLVVEPHNFSGRTLGGLKLGRPSTRCDSTAQNSSALPKTTHVSTRGWPWVGGSSFDFQLPSDFKRKNVMGIDSEVGEWDHGKARVVYDLGDYTGRMTEGDGFQSATECLDGVPVELAIVNVSEDPRYAVQLYVGEIGLAITGMAGDRKERDAILAGFRTIRFHDPVRRNREK